ncbi:MAG: nitronate monooxygenase family protein [Armatimonadetes bacterium]|nr:nitronate monooxygenase family protein [Armatimonadota bacterium]
MKLPALRIGNLEINPPIIQGGMGVRVSGAKLAAAVANEGCAGVIASVGLGLFEDAPGNQFVKLNDDALRDEIRQARKLSKGVIGVNVMVALSNYASLVKVAVEEKIDFIVSGAGLPLELPSLVQTRDIALVPIVSSGKALKVICLRWLKSHGRLPDAVIVEGPQAGGHLGFKYDDLGTSTEASLEDLLVEVVEEAKTYDPPIPVIAAGGVYTGEDIAKMIEKGAAGVQMATRFVCTDECDVDIKFKQAYVDATEDDIAIIHSPVGMPARVIKNEFVERISRGETIPFNCKYQCLRTCIPKSAPYCIAIVLANAAKGKLDQAFAFSGSCAPRIKEIISVKALINQLVNEAQAYYASRQTNCVEA